MGTIGPPTATRPAALSPPGPLIAALAIGLFVGFVAGRTTAPTAPPPPAPRESAPVVATAEPTKKTESITRALEENRAATPIPPTAVILPTQAPVRIESFVVRGDGPEASALFDLEAALYVFKLEHRGERNFIVDLLDANGKRIQNLVNVIGNFSGSRAVQIPRRGKYLLNVEHASGPWVAIIGPPESR